MFRSSQEIKEKRSDQFAHGYLKQLRESELPSNYKYNAVFNYLFLSLMACPSYAILL